MMFTPVGIITAKYLFKNVAHKRSQGEFMAHLSNNSSIYKNAYDLLCCYVSSKSQLIFLMLSSCLMSHVPVKASKCVDMRHLYIQVYL